MFSTIDHPGTRKLIVYLVGESGERVLLNRDLYRDLEKHFRTLPTKPRFDRLVERLKKRVKSAPEAKYLIVQYWKYSYERENSSMYKTLVFPKRVEL